MLRLAHLFSVDEHPTWSKPANVSLSAVFAKAGFKIATVVEMSLTGNAPLEVMDESKVHWPVTTLLQRSTIMNLLENTDGVHRPPRNGGRRTPYQCPLGKLAMLPSLYADVRSILMVLRHSFQRYVGAPRSLSQHRLYSSASSFRTEGCYCEKHGIRLITQRWCALQFS